MNGSLFNNMAPNAKRAFLVSFGLGAAAVVLYMFAVQPAQAGLARAKRELGDAEFRLQGVTRDLKEAPKVTERLAALDAARKPYLDALLRPLLESYAMRAKGILEPIAAGAGLMNVEYTELPPRALPLPKPVPKQLHARRPIRVEALGSYQSAVSFLMRLEKEHPLVAVQAFTVRVGTVPDFQQIDIVLEWPSLGLRTDTPKGPVTK